MTQLVFWIGGALTMLAICLIGLLIGGTVLERRNRSRVAAEMKQMPPTPAPRDMRRDCPHHNVRVFDDIESTVCMDCGQKVNDPPITPRDHRQAQRRATQPPPRYRAPKARHKRTRSHR